MPLLTTWTVMSQPQLTQVVTASVHLTANHLGWFEFRLCPVNEPGRYVKQSCLNQHVLALDDRPGSR